MDMNNSVCPLHEDFKARVDKLENKIEEHDKILSNIQVQMAVEKTKSYIYIGIASAAGSLIVGILSQVIANLIS